MTEKAMAAEEPRRRLRQVSLRIIREHARTIKVSSGGWEDVVDEIRTVYGYNVYDLLFVLAVTLRLHPHTGVPGAFRK